MQNKFRQNKIYKNDFYMEMIILKNVINES